jgi:o-succinylbenzoate---CoA ligase
LDPIVIRYFSKRKNEKIEWSSSDKIVIHHPRLNPHDLYWLEPYIPEGHILIQTSGTASEPKWVAISFSAMCASAKAVVDFYGLGRSDAWLCPLPVYHIGGAAIMARAYIQGAKDFFLEEKWSCNNFVERLSETQASLSSLVPTQLYDLVIEKRVGPPTLRHLFIGGGALSERLEEEARKLGWPIRRTYGMSETASQIASQKEGEVPLTLLPHLQVRVDEEGILSIAGTSLFTGYITPKGLQISHEEGWFKTQDRVKWNAASSTIMPLGRCDGGVKIGGRLIHLASIENVIEEVLLERGLPQNLFVRLLEDPRRGYSLVLTYVGQYPGPIIEEIQRRLPAWLYFGSIEPHSGEVKRKGIIENIK